MPKTLILITNHFPFGTAEGFIETEYPYLEKKFDKIFILSRDVTSEEIREGNFNFVRINPISRFSEKVFTILLFVKFLKRIINLASAEISYLKMHKKFTLKSLWVMLHDLSKALVTSHSVKKIIRTHYLSGEVVLYSYWLTSSALATTLVRTNRCSIKRIARAHGGDIYEERHKAGYLSFRNSLAMQLDSIHCISQNGQEYLKSRVARSFHNKLRISRLGTPDNGISYFRNPTKKIVLSCSFLVPVKRIDFLIDSLAFIKDEIEWVHIGDGPLANQIKSYAYEKLSPDGNIKYQFKGMLTAKEMQEFYRNIPVQIFLSTSSSEGIPVTMMEAQSFGIPILGLNVGGVSEIVGPANGRLMPADSNPEEFSEAIIQMLRLPEYELKILKEHARLNWSNHYNAEKNFSTFADQISSLPK